MGPPTPLGGGPYLQASAHTRAAPCHPACGTVPSELLASPVKRTCVTLLMLNVVTLCSFVGAHAQQLTRITTGTLKASSESALPGIKELCWSTVTLSHEVLSKGAPGHHHSRENAARSRAGMTILPIKPQIHSGSTVPMQEVRRKQQGWKHTP